MRIREAAWPSKNVPVCSEIDTTPQNITMWVAGGDTPQALRDYLSTTYKAKTGGTLTIEEQGWGDLVTKLTTALPDANNTPDVVEVGNDVDWLPMRAAGVTLVIRDVTMSGS